MKKSQVRKALILFIVILELSALFSTVDAQEEEDPPVSCLLQVCRRKCKTEDGEVGYCAANTPGDSSEGKQCRFIGDDECPESLDCVDKCLTMSELSEKDNEALEMANNNDQ